MSPSYPAGAGGHAAPATMSPSSSQVSLQLQQDLAKLAHKDPDTRRSSMEALKCFIEGELDAQKMPSFIEQVSIETNKGIATSTISLFVDVARVHKQVMVPFIPRIMAIVLHCLRSSASGRTGHSNNLHQASAKVVSAIARYTIEPASSSDRCSSSSTDVFDSLCPPLLGLLCSGVEPLAVGSATCLQAIVEAENWKEATQELVHDVCNKSSTALVEKRKHTLAHLHLVRSLAKSNPGALQEYAVSLLKVGVHILTAPAMRCAPACGPWQQRVAAAQLLGTLLGCLDQPIVAPELAPTMEALDSCRLDKVTMVRQAVGEALVVAKDLASSIDHILLHEVPTVARAAMSPPSHSRLLTAARKRNGKKKSQSCGSMAISSDMVLGSQESHAFCYAASPSSSMTTVLAPLCSPSPARKIGQSPAKQSPIFPPSSFEQYTTEPETPYLLKSSGSDKNTPLVGESGETLVTTKFDDSSYAGNGSGNKAMEEVVNAEEAMDDTCTKKHEQEGAVQEIDNLEADLGSDKDSCTDIWACKDPKSEDPTWEREAWSRWECPPTGQECETRGSQEWSGDLTATSCCTLLPIKGDSMKGAAYVQGSFQLSKKYMSAQDLILSTPRRLVWSLQSASSTPDSEYSPQRRDQGMNLEYETLSESGWSVRDNPIAGSSGSEEDECPRKRRVTGRKHQVISSKDKCSCCEGGGTSPIEDEKIIDCLRSGVTLDTTFRSSGDSSPLFGILDVPETEDHGGWIGKHGESGSCVRDNISLLGAKSGQSDGPKHKGIAGLEEKETVGLKPPRVWVSYVEKLQHDAGVLLFGALLIVLFLTAFMAIVNGIRGQYDPDMLVPT